MIWRYIYEILYRKSLRIKDLEKRLYGDKPDNWVNHTPSYKTRDGLRIPPNTFITDNDRDIKKWLIKRKYHLMPYNELIYALEEDIYLLIQYTRDTDAKGNLTETWRTASETFKDGLGDCDDKAILFQTCMHILRRGHFSVCVVNGAKFPGYEGGHMYNKCLVNNEWVIIDPTNPKRFRDETWIYDIRYTNLNWFFNKWGTYKLPYNRVLK